MIKTVPVEEESAAVFLIWVLLGLIARVVLGMMNDGGQRQQGGVSRHAKTNGFIPSSFRALSSYLRIVSSGASTVARSAVSVASSIVDRDDDTNHDQVRALLCFLVLVVILSENGAIGERLIVLAKLCEFVLGESFTSFIAYY